MAKKTKKTDAAIQPPEAQVLIKWNVPDTIISRFASNMVVQTIEGSYFKLTFFELKPEIHLIPPTAPPTEIVADCVASIIIPPEKMPAIIDVLTKQLHQLQKKFEEQIKASSIEPGQPS